MTIEEHIENLKAIASDMPSDKCSDWIESLMAGVKALEQEPCEVSQGLVKDSQGFSQEPCEDCISREAVIKTISEWLFSKEFHYTNATEYLRNRLDELPSVTPQPKMGKWKAYTHSAYHGNDEDGEPIWREVTVYHCNMCNRRTVIKENYCPNCGREMQGVEE